MIATMLLLLHTNRPACIRLAGAVVGLLLLKGGQGIYWDTTVLVPAVHRKVGPTKRAHTTHSVTGKTSKKPSTLLCLRVRPRLVAFTGLQCSVLEWFGHGPCKVVPDSDNIAS